MTRPFDPSTFPARWGAPHAEQAAAAWRTSGLSVLAFARRHGLHEKRLYRWFRRLGVMPSPASPRLRRPEVGTGFVEVVVPPPAAAPRREQRECFAIDIGEVTVRVPPSFDPDALAQLLGVLRC